MEEEIPKMINEVFNNLNISESLEVVETLVSQMEELITSDDMWEKSTTWAVKKDGGVRAKAVCNTEEEAQNKLAELGKGHSIEVRPGERTRCANYCQVRDFCGQWKDYNSGETN